MVNPDGGNIPFDYLPGQFLARYFARRPGDNSTQSPDAQPAHCQITVQAEERLIALPARRRHVGDTN
jgi:hypothetical protein